MIRRLALALIFAALALAPPGAAQSPAPAGDAADPLGATDVRQVAGPPHWVPLTGDVLERRSAEISALLRCPVCQGLSIADSPASLARQMKTLVRQMLAAGYDERQILAYFEYSYGEFVLLEPPVRGVAGLVWLAPLAVLLLGGAALAWRLRRTAGRGDSPPASATAATGPVTAVDRPTPGAASPAVSDELAPYLERVRRMTSGTDRPEAPAASPTPETE